MSNVEKKKEQRKVQLDQTSKVSACDKTPVQPTQSSMKMKNSKQKKRLQNIVDFDSVLCTQ